jgi:hypothetical protein
MLEKNQRFYNTKKFGLEAKERAVKALQIFKAAWLWLLFSTSPRLCVNN